MAQRMLLFMEVRIRRLRKDGGTENFECANSYLYGVKINLKSYEKKNGENV